MGIEMSETTAKIKQIREELGFPITTAKEIFNTEYPEENFLVEDLIPMVGLVILCGAPKSGKSFFALLLGHAITTSSEFLGKSIKNAYCCLYLSLEDSENRQKTRMRTIGLNPAEIFLIATKWSYNQRGIQDLVTLMQKYPEIKVIIIDTLGRFSRERETTGFQADYDFISQFKDITDKYQIVVILIHHTRKTRDDYDIYNDILGSSANTAAVDTILLLQRTRSSSKALLSCIGRDLSEKTYELTFTETCTWEMMGEASQRASSPERQRILDVLIAQGELSPSQIVGYIPGQSAKNIANLLALMREEGLVVNASKRGYWRPAEQYTNRVNVEG
jgi:RecA-family ATPase